VRHATALRVRAVRLIAVGILATLVGAAPAAAAPAPRTGTFATPSAIAALGSLVVVANQATSTLSVLSASSGALVATVSHTTLGVSAPASEVATTSEARSLLLVAGASGKVAELVLTMHGTTPTFTRLRLLTPSGCESAAAARLTTDARGHVVEVCGTGVVTEWVVRSGGLVHRIPKTRSGLTHATSLAVLGTSLYVTNAHTAAATGPDAVIELSLATGKHVRTVTNTTSASYGFSAPSGVAARGTSVWVINAGADTIDQLGAATLSFLGSSSTNLTDPGVVLASSTYVYVSSNSVNGSSSMVTQFTGSGVSLSSPWMMCNSNGPYQFGDPSGFAISGTSLWVSNPVDNLVDQMNASTGALVNTYA
jgi:hypothetical protein